jgi:succinate dehydrogenase / fumarate reductase cytochrome b subunit
MNRLLAIYSSNLGKKIIAAVTGLILFGFLAGHVAGNLKVFTGETAEGVPHVDEYGHYLRVIGEPMVPAGAVIWTARLVLLVAVVLHIIVVIQLAMQSAEARPVGYAKTKRRMASAAALYMMFSGGLIAFFIVFHILHFTTGTIQFGEFEHGQIYKNLSNSFSSTYWYVPLFYIVTMVVIGFHLNHGVWSLFQTLGLDNPDRNKYIRWGSTIVSVLIIAGFIAIPLSFLSGAMPGLDTIESYSQTAIPHK